jgi:hypothetical protein
MIRMLVFASTARVFALLCEVLAQEGYWVLDAANNYEGLSVASRALLEGGASRVWYLVLG